MSYFVTVSLFNSFLPHYTSEGLTFSRAHDPVAHTQHYHLLKYERIYPEPPKQKKKTLK